MKMKKSLITLLALLSASGVDVVIAAQSHATKASPKKRKHTAHTGTTTAHSAQTAAAPQDAKANIASMLTLFKNSLGANILNDQQKAYVQGTLIPTLESELNSTPIEQAINTAFSQQDTNATIQTLHGIVQANQGKQLDPASQHALGQALKDLMDTSVHLDPHAIASLAQLVQQASASNLVPHTMLPDLKANLPALSPMPNPFNANLVANLQNPQERIDGMQALVDKAGGRPMDHQTQNIFAGTLQALVSHAHLLDPQDMIRLSMLVGSSTTSSMLTPEQKHHVQKQLVPAVHTPATKDLIKKLMESGTPAEKMAAIQQLMNQNKGLPLDPETQNAFAEALTKIAGDKDKMTPQERTALTNLLDDASKGSALSPEQKKFVKEKMVPAVAPEPTVDAIAQAMNLKDPAQRMDALKALMAGAEGKDIDPAVQNAYAQALQTLQADAGNMSPADQAQLRGLLADTGKSKILSPAQKEFVAKTMLPAIVPPATAGNIDTVMQNGDAGDQLAALEVMVQKQGTNPADPATQEAYNKAIHELKAKAEHGELSADEEARLEKLMAASGQSGLLNAQQQKIVATQAKNVRGGVSAEAIDAIGQGGGSPSDQIENLELILKQQGNKPADPATQNAYAKVIQDLMAKGQRGELSEADKIKLKKLMIASGQSGLLSKEQQTFVADQSGNVGGKIDAGSIETLMKNNASPSSQMDDLEFIIKQQGSKPADAATQNAYAKTIQDLIGKAQRGELSEADKIKLKKLMVASGKSGLLNGDQQKFVAEQAAAIAGKVDAGSIETLMQSSGSASEQMDNLEFLMKQQAGKPTDPATQNAVAKAIQDLMDKNKRGELSPAEKIKLKKLMAASGQTGLLNPEQQKFVREQAGTIAAAVDAGSIEQIIKEGGSPSDQIDNLELMIKQQGNKPADPATQNAYAKAIQDLMAKNQRGELSPAEKIKLKKLMIASGQTGLLSNDQKKFVVDQSGSVGAVVDAGTIETFMKDGGSPSDQMDTLEFMLKQQGGKAADPATQNAYAKAIQDLMAKNQRGELSPAEKIKLKKLMDASGQSGLLSPEQRKFVADQSGNIGVTIDAGAIETLTQGGKSASDQMDNLEFIIKQQGNKPADAATQNAVAKAIQDLMDRNKRGELSPTEKIKLKKLMAASGQSGLLSPEQQKIVREQVSNVGGTVDAESIEILIKEGGSPSDQMNNLELMLKQQGSKPADKATQDAYAKAIQDLMAKNQRGELSPAEKIKLKKLIDASGQGGLLNPAQQKFVREQAGNIGAVIDAGSIESLTKDSGSASDQIDNLEFILKQQGGKPADPATQNAYAQAIQGLMAKNQRGELSPAEKIKLKKLLLASGQGGLLNPEQQKFVREQAVNVGGAVDAGSIETLMQDSKSSSDQLDNLEFIMQQQGGKPADPSVQVMYTKTIQELLAKKKRGELSPAEQTKLKKLIDASGKSGLLNAEQQKIVASQSDGGGDVSAADIESIGQGGSPSSQMDQLERMLKQQGSKPADKATQNAYAKMIQDLMEKNKRGELSPAEKIKLKKLMLESGKGGLLSPEQQKFVADQSGNVGATVDANSIESLTKDGGSASDQMDNLEFILKQQGGKPADPATQNAYAKAIQDLMAKNQRGELSPAEKIKLKKLMLASGKGGLLNGEQQKFVIDQAGNVGGTVDAGAIETLMQESSSTGDQLDNLKFIMKQQGGKPADKATQKIYAKTIKDLIARKQRGELSPDEQEKLQKLITDSGQSGMLDEEDQKQVQEQAAASGITPHTKKGSGKKTSPEAASQLTDLDTMLQQQSGKPVDPATQATNLKLIQDLVAKQANGELSPTDTIKLQKLLQNAQQSGAVPKGSVNGAIEQIINDLGPTGPAKYTGRDQNLTDIAQVIKSGSGKKFSPEEQNSLAGKLQSSFGNMNNMNDHDKDEFRNMLRIALESDMLSPEQKAYIKNTMIPQLTKAVMKELDDLDALLSGGSLQGTAEDQNIVADRIMRIFKNRPRNNIPYLMQFRAIIVSQLSGPLLSGPQKEYIKTVIIPALDLDINGGVSTDAGGMQGAEQTGKRKDKKNRRNVAFGKEADDVSALFESGKKMTPEEQNAAAGRLQKLFENRPQDDVESLEKTRAALQRALDSGALTPEQEAHVRGLLKQVDGDIAQARAKSQAGAQEADAVGALFEQNKGKNLTPEQQNAAAGRLQKLFENRPQGDAETLEKTKAALQKALDSGALTPEQDAHVRGLLKQVNKEAAKARAAGPDKANSAAAQEIAALANMIDPNKKYTPEEQNAIAAKIQDLFAKRSVNDAAGLQSLMDALNKALNSGALTDAQKEYIRNTLLPQLAKDLADANASSSGRGSRRKITIATAAAPTAAEIYNRTLAELSQFIANARQNTAPALQQSIAGLIQGLFDGRPKQDSETLKRLAHQLTLVKSTSLVNQQFKASMDKMIATVNADNRRLLTGGQ